MHATNRSVFVCLLSAAASFALAGSAAAMTLDEWGTDASTSAADCPSFCTNFTFGTSTGGQNELTADSSVSTFQGNAQSLAELDPGPGLNVPQLQAEAFSTSSGLGSAFGRALGVEGYTYTGSGSKTFNLDIMLTGTVIDSTPADNDTFIRAQVYIFEPDNFVFTGDLATLIFEFGAQEITSTELVLDVTTGSLSDTLTFTLATGESVYLWSRLDAEAQRDLSSADAFSTLDMGFQDGDGLVAASTIPEPGTFSLVALGTLALAWRRRART